MKYRSLNIEYYVHPHHWLSNMEKTRFYCKLFYCFTVITVITVLM